MEAEGEEILKSGAPPIEAVLCLCLTIISQRNKINQKSGNLLSEPPSTVSLGYSSSLSHYDMKPLPLLALRNDEGGRVAWVMGRWTMQKGLGFTERTSS